MSEFSYAVVSSILHDREAIESIFSAFEPFFANLGGTRVSLGRVAETATPPFFFVLTGGTEGIVLDYLKTLPPRAKPFPLVLIAHAHHNSLPAALEIAARARQEGGSAIVIQLRSPSDSGAGASIREAVALCRAVAEMRSSRIGAVGEPSDWLIASSQGAPAVAASWGATLESASLGDLQGAIEEIRRQDAMRDEKNGERNSLGKAPLSEGMSAFIAGATSVKEPVAADFYKSDTIYRALSALARARGFDALTLRCFDILSLDGSTGCYALSRLSDDGIDAGCEGDVPSIIALRWMRLLTGKPAWMANPSEIVEDAGEGKGKLLLAHCTVPKSLLAGYGVRSHFESGRGVAVAGRFAPCPVTLARVGGKGLDEVWVAEGWLESSPSDEGLCRTQAVIRLDSGDIARFLAAPLGNHLVVGFAHCAAAARRYLALEHLREI